MHDILLLGLLRVVSVQVLHNTDPSTIRDGVKLVSKIVEPTVRNPGFLALCPVRGLLLRAKHLFVAATFTTTGALHGGAEVPTA